MLRTAERSFQRKNIGHAAEKQFWKGLRIEDFLLAEGWRTDWPDRAKRTTAQIYTILKALSRDLEIFIENKL